MSNRTIVELNHDYCPRTDIRELLAWAIRMRLYMNAADPSMLPNGVTFLHYRHHSEPLPFKAAERVRSGLRPELMIDQVVDEMLANATGEHASGAVASETSA